MYNPNRLMNEQQIITVIRVLGAAYYRQQLGWRALVHLALKKNRLGPLNKLRNEDLSDPGVEEWVKINARVTLNLAKTLIGGPTLQLPYNDVLDHKTMQMQFWAIGILRADLKHTLQEWQNPAPFLWLDSDDQNRYLRTGSGDLRVIAGLCKLELPKNLPNASYSSLALKAQRLQHTLGRHGAFWASEEESSVTTCQACNAQRDVK